MKQYKNIDEFLKGNDMTREDLKCIIAESALLLAMECAHNFDGEAKDTEKVSQPLFYLNLIIDEVK